MHRHSESPGAAVSGMDQVDDNPTLNIAACTLVGLIPFCGDASSYVFKQNLHLHSGEAINQHYERGEVTTLLEAGLQILLILFLLYLYRLTASDYTKI